MAAHLPAVPGLRVQRPELIHAEDDLGSQGLSCTGLVPWPVDRG